MTRKPVKDNCTVFEKGCDTGDLFLSVLSDAQLDTGYTDQNGEEIHCGDTVTVFHRTENCLNKVQGTVSFGEYASPPEGPKYHYGYYIEWPNGCLLRRELLFWVKEGRIWHVEKN